MNKQELLKNGSLQKHCQVYIVDEGKVFKATIESHYSCYYFLKIGDDKRYIWAKEENVFVNEDDALRKANLEQRLIELEEENKDLEQRLIELEEENKNLKLCRCCDCQSENEFMLQGLIRDLEKENAKLQEQLKFATEIPDKIINYVCDCTYIKEPDYTNVVNYICKLKEEVARKK